MNSKGSVNPAQSLQFGRESRGQFIPIRYISIMCSIQRTEYTKESKRPSDTLAQSVQGSNDHKRLTQGL